MPSYKNMILVRSQIPNNERMFLHREHKANFRGLQNALKTVDWVNKQYSLAYRYPKGYHIWMEYEGKVLEVVKARMAIIGGFGEWGVLEEVLDELLLGDEK